MSSSAASADADSALLPIPVICGPTASGKSAIAMWLSQRREITIVSADSRQIYRGFDVGTAKPSAADQARVPHRGVDVVAPTERYSAADWGEAAVAAIGDALAARRLPVIVGGTGFYIASLFRPLWAQPALDPGRRERLQRVLGALSLDDLKQWCSRLDPARAHLGRTQLLRAIEVALLTGRRLSELHVEHARPTRYRPRYLLVDPGTELAGRIVRRATEMLDGAWPDEVRSLAASVPDDAPAWKATGYDAVREHVQGRAHRDETLERVVIETRQYAKRQRTWFRHQLDARHVQRLSSHASGWQETVDRWISDVETEMRDGSRSGHA